MGGSLFRTPGRLGYPPLFLASLAALVLALPAVLISLPFWVMMEVTRRLAALLDGPYVGEYELFRFHPKLGWSARPGLDTLYLERGGLSYARTDAEGWPGTGSLRNAEVVVVGDSFPFGYGAERGKCFTHLVPEIPLKALACPGYDLVQEVVLLQDVSEQLSGKLVLWFVCLENDFAQSLSPVHFGRAKPMLREVGSPRRWTISLDHIRPTRRIPVSDPLFANPFPRLCAPGWYLDRHMSAFRFLVQEARNLCAATEGTQLAVLTIPQELQLSSRGRDRLKAQAGSPTGFDPFLLDRELERICQEENIPVIPLRGHLGPRDYRRFDRSHWTRSGHRKAAAVVRRTYAAWRTGTLSAPDAQMGRRHFEEGQGPLTASRMEEQR